MALTRASEVPTENMREGQLNLDELGREGAAVLITVTGFAEEKDWGNGVCRPVEARVVALTGSHAGEIDDEALIFKAGIRNKLHEVGQSVVGRLRPYGARKATGLEAEEDGDVALAEAVLKQLDGDDSAGEAEPEPPAPPKQRTSSTPVTDGVKAAKASAKARKVNIGGSNDDDEPPF